MIGAILERLAAHGLAEGDAPARHLLFETALQAFRARVGLEPVHASWVPGRLEVFGKHTDYAGGHTLVAAMPRGFAFVARGREDGIVRILDAARVEELTLDLREIPGEPGDRSETSRGSDGRALTGWRNYAAVVIRRLARNFPGATSGADVVFASDLPSASGMSSSSALMVGLADAMVRLAALEAQPGWRANIRAATDVAGYYACIENGMAFGTLDGDAGVGTHGGSEDHAAIVCGRPGELSAWRFVPIQQAGHVALPPHWTFVIAASGVAAKKTGPAREAYNRLSREARTLLDLWNQAEAPRRSLRDVVTADASAAARLLDLVHRSGLNGPVTVALERRLQHFLREDARVLEALEAFRSADDVRLGMLSGASQADAEALLGNQVPETIALARAARALGAFAASSFGAGFGGSVWALIERDAASAFAERWMADYRVKFSDRLASTAFLARPAPPLVSVTGVPPTGVRS